MVQWSFYYEKHQKGSIVSKLDVTEPRLLFQRKGKSCLMKLIDSPIVVKLNITVNFGRRDFEEEKLVVVRLDQLKEFVEVAIVRL